MSHTSHSCRKDTQSLSVPNVQACEPAKPATKNATFPKNLKYVSDNICTNIHVLISIIWLQQSSVVLRLPGWASVIDAIRDSLRCAGLASHSEWPTSWAYWCTSVSTVWHQNNWLSTVWRWNRYKNSYYTTKIKLETFDISTSFRSLHWKEPVLNSQLTEPICWNDDETLVTRSLCLLRRSLPQMEHGVWGSVWQRRCDASCDAAMATTSSTFRQHAE